MISVLILLIILCILSCLLTGVCIYAAYRASTAFLAIEAKQQEYKRFFDIILLELTEDAEFLRSDLFRRIGSTPDLADVNSKILYFQNRLEATKDALKEYKLVD